jgi:hypothetical protein
VVCSGQNCFNTARANCISDLLTISRDDHAVYVTGGTGALRDPANHGFSSNIDESFSR